LYLFSFGFLFLQSPAVAQIKPVKRILILNEVGPFYPITNLINQGIRSGLDNSPYHLEFYYEYFETTLFPDPADQKQFRDFYIQKYQKRMPNLVITVGPGPLSFMIEAHKEFFPGVPVVFCLPNGLVPAAPTLDSDFTGVETDFAVQETLSAALRLQPDTEHVVVIGGVANYDRQREAAVRQQLKTYAEHLDISYLTDLAMPALLERLRHLPKHTIVLMTAIGLDAGGTKFTSAETGLLVSAASNAPVFSLADVYLGHGEVGGDVSDLSRQGKTAADLALRTLGGEKPQDIPRVRGMNTYEFDWKAMQRWGFKESNLPPGSVVFNQSPGFWQSYKWYILAGVFAFLAQTIAIISLLWQRQTRRKAEVKLLQSNERLRIALEAGKSVGWEWDLVSGRQAWFGDLSTMFGIPSDKPMPQSDDLFNRVHPQDRGPVSKALAAARDSREPFSAEFRMMRSDGRVCWVVSRGKFEYAKNGEARRMLGMAVDVTERKLAESASRQSEEKFSKAFRESPLALTINSVNDHRYIEVNETFERISGWRRDEVIGKTPRDIGLWAEPDQRTQLIKRLKEEGSVRNIEVPFRTKDGRLGTGLGSVELIELDGEPCALFVVADITDLKDAEERLIESQERLQSVVESAMDAIIAVDQEQRIVVFNTAAETMFECSAQDAIGTSIGQFIPLDSHDKYPGEASHFNETSIATRSMGVLTGLSALTAKGRKFPIEASMSPVGAGDKKLFTLVIRDLTERKQAEEARSRHTAIVESSHDAIISLDLHGVICSWNLGAARMLGYSETEAVGQPISLVTAPEFRERQCNLFREVRIGETIQHYEMVDITKDGKRIDVSITLSPLRDWTGKIVGVSKIARDITLHKQAEAALRESEERFRLVANKAPVMIWMSDPDKQCTYLNQPWLKFTGRSYDQELGDGWAEGVHPQDLQAVLETYGKAFDRLENFEMEYRLRRHDGEYRWIYDLGVPRFNADGSFAGYIGSCLDVTERKRAEEALSMVSRRLIGAHEEERTRIARELHDDINQRLAVLAVAMGVLKRDLPASATEMISRVGELKEQIKDLGNDIQALSHRLHSSKLEYLGLGTAAAAFCREFSEHQDVEVEFQSESIPKALSPEISLCLFRVLQEALQNAAKYSGSKHFRVSLVSSLDQIQMTISDEGIGFDPEEAMRGHGLGITSMRERLNLVDGQFSIDSRTGKGTIIQAKVPLRSVARSTAAGKA
jgi:PAS domain S-box-containing protein